MLLLSGCAMGPSKVVNEKVRENVFYVEAVGSGRFESYENVEKSFHSKAGELCGGNKYEYTLQQAMNDGSSQLLAVSAAAGGVVAQFLTPGFEPLVTGEIYCDGAIQSIVHEARNGNRIRVLGLIQAGANINAIDEDGRTALMYASMNGHMTIIIDLLGSNASVDIKDRHGKTALSLARDGDKKEIVELLKSKGAME